MCGHCIPDGIMVCPSCKRDNEAYRLGEADSPFTGLGDGRFRCLCGHVFDQREAAVGEPDYAEQEAVSSPHR